MNKRIIIISILVLASLLHFASCTPKDKQKPKLYLLGADGKPLKPNEKDTTVLLYTKYVDPGVIAEDNKDKSSDIIIVDNINEVLSFTKKGYLKATRNPAVITYTATDKAGNPNSIERKVYVNNISNFLEGRYNTKRAATPNFGPNDYFSNITSDNRVPGRIRFSKVLLHKSENKNIYYRVIADLFSPSKKGHPASSEIAFMGGNDKDIVFFDGMTIEDSLEDLHDRGYNLLFIAAQEYAEETDETGEGSNKVFIAGVEGQDGLPLSRIEYIENSNTIKRIILELNVTKNNVANKITEIYIPD